MIFDAVIVGAGHNGLAAAIHLASNGWKVAVVEATSEAGGSVKTREITLPGFRHDLFAMNLSLFSGSEFFRSYKDDLVANGLDFVTADDCFATPYPDDTWLGVSRDPDATANRIDRISPPDAHRWREMTAGFAADAPDIFKLLNVPLPSWAAFRILWSIYRSRGSAWLGELLQNVLASPRDFLDARFESEKLKAMVAAWGMHLDFAPDVAGGALFPYLESMADQSFGMTLGRGGADTMICSMAKCLESKGGKLLLGSAVERIEEVDGRAAGVRLADGSVLRAQRAVIANLHPRLVFGRLLPSSEGRAEFEQKASRFRSGPGTMMIHLAMSDLPEWRAGPELKRFAYVHLAPGYRMMSVAYAEALDGLLPREPVLVVGQPTAIDPTRAPAGKHVLWVQVRPLPADIRGDAAGEISSTVWDEVKDQYADRIVAQIEKYAPGTANKVLASAVLSPVDLQRENANLIGGDGLSGSHHLDQNFLFRPLFGWSRYKTPLRGLFLIGASTWPGAGLNAGSGYMLASMLLRKKS